VLPTNRVSAFSRTMQSISAQPNYNLTGNPWIEHNFRTYYPVVQDRRTLTLKGDHTFSPRDTISGRYTGSPDFSAQYGGQYGFPPPGCTNCGGTASRDYKVHSATIRETHVFSPTFFNELQLAANRAPGAYGTLGDTTNWANKLGLPNPFGALGWPTIYSDAYNMFYGGGWDGDNIHNQNMTAFNVEDNVTWIKGKHTIQFGFKARQEYNNIQELQQAEGSHSFYSNWTALYDPSAQSAASYSGSGLADLMLGLPTTLRNQYNRGYFYFRQKELGAYINDTWKVTPRLTLGFGLRWDHWTPYKEKYDRLATINMSSPLFQVITPNNTTIESMPNIPYGVLASWKKRGLSWTTANQANFTPALIQNYWKDLGPRFAATACTTGPCRCRRFSRPCAPIRRST
ncbi:MAG: TonB-dependent receptor, partial [Acidobacteria bacterium]|nr:TonB-dependent receptor [Acidobacteriota bacterium]